jgi:hypothetical protein
MKDNLSIQLLIDFVYSSLFFKIWPVRRSGQSIWSVRRSSPIIIFELLPRARAAQALKYKQKLWMNFNDRNKNKKGRE